MAKEVKATADADINEIQESRMQDVRLTNPYSQIEMAARPTIIVGLGKTGLSCARYLAARGTDIVVVDNRMQPPELAALYAELPDVPVYLGDFDENVLKGAEEIVLSPGVSLQEPAIKRVMDQNVPIIGDIELFAREIHTYSTRIPVIAVTGSNGKSTVTSLVAEMARMDGRVVCAGGNLGPPALALLDDERTTELFVLELSSFQLETTTSLNPLAATILNLSEDHMDRYADMSSYARAKRRIFAGDGAMILNLDDSMVMTMGRSVQDSVKGNSARRVIGFTLGVPGIDEFGVIDQDDCSWIAFGKTPLLPIAALKLQGMHNVANALAAFALGTVAWLSLSAMQETLREFSGLSHRCQLVADRDGVRWFNDSKATNVGATVAAIQGLGHQGRLVLIAGGDGKGADFSPLKTAVHGVVRAMVLLGQDSERIAATVQDVIPVVYVNDMHDAVRQACKLAHPGDNVLLSPACASWDMYRDYQERGELFMAAVNAEVL
uniref:UDP-N-acetylmuramoylalanine--D-glutamate ligase n=1 Tax=Candidatus Kentrum sp. TUN TaxID=2126343 RepID=A0A450ZD06_9GAMM|nr:MAG: UDP-N-acetylmuramoylalanine--D-glutamate ligase [Candidatus Kentron sp. TUN]VFK52314.1 MAG: UDP-N-acetylmuramoylalanine--D-glutamate ligase [Candidatus Kentron sp. TUN]VFK52745.1 MAG: UDP-N-acetylmuramoylalanine--D-glutamate ligase [Candidatus Kentron sp. TUN]